MLVQTQRAIANLKAAGLKRNEFKVQVERKQVGRDVEYGDLNITLLCSHERAVELTPELVKYFRVYHYKWNGKTSVSVDGEGVPGLTVKNI